MTLQDKQQFMKQLALWSRVHGKKRPTTKDGWKILLAEFIAQSQQAVEEEQPAWNEVPDQDETHLIDDGATVQIADVHKEGVFEDDWDRLLRDRAAASIGPNGELLDDFDTEFQMMGRQQAELARTAPWTRDNPPSLLKGNLGDKATVLLGADAIMVANWIGDDAETTPVTITVAPIQNPFAAINASAQPPDLNSTVGYYRPYALINFGTKSNQVSLSVDVDRGCQLTISASAVTVAVGLEESAQFGGNAVVGQPGVPQMTLLGMLSFKPVVRTTPITRTVYCDAVPGTGGTSVFADTPPFAKSLRVIRSNSSAVAVACRLAIYDGNGLAGVVTMAAGEIPEIFLPGDARYVQIRNDSGAAESVNFKLVYNLSL